VVRLKAESLSKVFGKVVALNNISFDLEGDIIAIVGPNGSGKTTLLTIATGLRHPSRGRFYLNGLEPYKEREKVLDMVVFSFEKPRFNLSVRVRDVVDVAKNMCRDSNNFIAAVENLGIQGFSSRKLYEYSSGQSQLLALALTLFCDTKSIAILDEPLSHLDISYRSVFLDVFNSRKNIVFTTHVVEEAEAVADKILVIDNGMVKWVGGIDELYRERIYEVAILRRGIKRFAELLAWEGGEIIADFGTHILARGIDEEKLHRLFTEGVIVGYRRAGLRMKMYEKS